MQFLKTITKLLLIVVIALGFAKGSSAQVLWTLNDVTFYNGNTATGSFTTNSAGTSILSFSIDLTGPASGAAFTATQMVDAYLPNTIGIANGTFSEYVDLYLSSPVTGAGGIIPISSGYDCPGCGTLIINSDTEIIGTTPEPATMFVFGSGLLVLAGIVRRKKLLNA